MMIKNDNKLYVTLWFGVTSLFVSLLLSQNMMGAFFISVSISVLSTVFWAYLFAGSMLKIQTLTHIKSMLLGGSIGILGYLTYSVALTIAGAFFLYDYSEFPSLFKLKNDLYLILGLGGLISIWVIVPCGALSGYILREKLLSQTQYSVARSILTKSHDNAAVGFFLAPIVPSLLLFIVFVVYDPYSKFSVDTHLFVYVFYLYMLFSSAITSAYSILFILGIPAYLVYRKLGLTSFKSYVIGGAILGSIVPLFPMYISPLSTVTNANYLTYLITAIFGAVTCICYWLIVVKKPNKRLQLDAAKSRD